MKYPVAVIPKKSQFSMASVWNLVRSLRRKAKGEDLFTGRMSLLLPVRIECASASESWLVQHRLADLGADWEANLGRSSKGCTPWNMRSNLYLIVKFSVRPGSVRRPCLDWVTHEEFDAMQIPSVSGESLLLDYHHILPHRGEPA